MTGWREVTLSEVAAVNPRMNPLAADAPFVTMSDVEEWGVWARPSGPRGSRGGVRATGGDVLMARITPCLENGKIAKVSTELPDIGGSTEFVVLRAGPLLTADYLFLWASSGETHSQAVSLMTGSTGRQRVAAKDIAALPIQVPSLAEQAQIVEVVASVEMDLASLRRELAAAEALLQSLVEHQLSELESSVPLGELLTFRSGPSWSADAEHRTAAEGRLRVVKITNTKPDGTLDLRDETYVAGLPSSTTTLTETSLIVIRTNGNRDRIGNVYRAAPEVYGAAVSAFQFAAQAADPLTRDFAYWSMRRNRTQAAISRAASGTTGLGNVAAGWLKAYEVPHPRDTSQMAAIISRIEETSDLVEGLRSEVSAAFRLRASIRDSLVTGAVRLPQESEE